jgi:hypothetical protein
MIPMNSNKIPQTLVRWSLVGMVCIAGLVAPGCGKHGVPLNRSVQVGPAPADQATMERAIESSLARRKWAVKEKAPGRYTAVLDERKHAATIAIVYDAQGARIDYVDSTNLLYEKSAEGELIHRQYNNWVKSLANDISVAARSPAAPGAPPPPPGAPPPAAPPPPPSAAAPAAK